jgi:hypothetical protein
MPLLKEAILVRKGDKYAASHQSDTDLLAKCVDVDKFLEKIEKTVHDDPDFLAFRKNLRILRCCHAFVGLVGALYVVAFIVSMVGDISGGKKDPYEYLFLGFCVLLLSFFATILWMLYVEASKLRGLRQRILKKLRDTLSDAFTDCTFTINMDRSLTLRVRPTDMNQKEDAEFDPEHMDYYDYINYNNPEDEDYYNKQNPYELDPHEKNIMADIVHQREKAIEKETKKARKFRFLAASSK